MANNDDTLLRDVQEELRRERMQELWNRYGTYFLVGALGILAAIGATRYYIDSKARAAAAAGADYEKALALISQSKPADAMAALDTLAKTGPKGYAALARLQLAAAHVKAGEKDKAAEVLKSLADDRSADSTLKSIASLQLASMKVGDGAFTEVENRLNDLAADTSPFRANARELIALGALKAGRSDTARAALEQILADPSAPQGARNRAQVLLAGIVAGDLAKPAAPAVSPGPSSAGAGTGGAEKK
ncbi:MAG: tetratricopeptide repeat protein [Hyphomicrobiaceae bacterium]